MARLKKGVTFRKVERPYTRKSKYKKHMFVRACPHSKIVKYDMGNVNGEYQYQIDLISKQAIQLRHNCLEAGRLTSNRLIEKKAGRNFYHLRLRVYPHHILRENPLATGAGADRLSTGMKKSFGKPVGVAARVKEGQVIVSLYVKKEHLVFGKQALKKFSHKLPFKYTIVVKEIIKPLVLEDTNISDKKIVVDNTSDKKIIVES